MKINIDDDPEIGLPVAALEAKRMPESEEEEWIIMLTIIWIMTVLVVCLYCMTLFNQEVAWESTGNAVVFLVFWGLLVVNIVIATIDITRLYMEESELNNVLDSPTLWQSKGTYPPVADDENIMQIVVDSC